MMTFLKISIRPKHFHRLTGLNINEFNIILDKFRSSWQEFVNHEFLSKNRKRKYGGGRHARLLSLEDKLLFILVYVRMYPILFIQGNMFGIEESRACDWVQRLLPLLDQAMGYTHKRPKRGAGRNLEEILAEFPELKEYGITLDGTERPVRRPKNKLKQQDCYSGKKKRHTKKNTMIVDLKNTKILFLSKTRGGRMHDKKCIDQENLHCHSPNITCLTDTGLLGYHAGTLKILMPKKNTKLHKLSDSDKEQNRAISSIRVIAEHAIAGVKRSRCVLDTCRNIKENTNDLLMSVACSLHNLRADCRQYA